MTNIVIENQTAGTLTYLSGAISVAASPGTTTISSPFQILALATDGKFRSDILLQNITLTDGTNSFGGNDAINLMYELVQNIGPNSDGVGNNLTSTSINGKQRLDVNSASEGTDGSASPFYTTQVGGKDGSGNLQSLSTDTTGALFTSDRLPLTASAPAAVSVGVTSGVVIAANASRRGLVLTNTSLGIISFNIVGGAAVLRSGITLYPGGHWEMDPYTFTTAAINGISSVAASNLAIQELI